jgi:hypothetical protein
MKINRGLKLTVADIWNGYEDKGWDGVVGYGGRLDIRPIYQREFIYVKPEDRRAVLETIFDDCPLNLMYWVKRADGNYELLDGQQRTLSIMKFLDHQDYWEENGAKYYADTPAFATKRKKILDYKLDIAVIEDATKDEILKLFNRINIKGKELNDQERLNAIYTGVWLTDAKRYFSRRGEGADGPRSGQYLNGAVERQDHLATALDWISNGDVAGYMAAHARDADAGELVDYFGRVIDWAEATFPDYNPEMKKVAWGELYNKNKDRRLDADALREKVSALMKDGEIDNKKYIYEFVLIENPTVGDDRKLSKRAFSDADKMTAWERQGHRCAICGKELPIEKMEGDHKIPWSKGGRTALDNLEMLCGRCNLAKSAREI